MYTIPLIFVYNLVLTYYAVPKSFENDNSWYKNVRKTIFATFTKYKRIQYYNDFTQDFISLLGNWYNTSTTFSSAISLKFIPFVNNLNHFSFWTFSIPNDRIVSSYCVRKAKRLMTVFTSTPGKWKLSISRIKLKIQIIFHRRETRHNKSCYIIQKILYWMKTSSKGTKCVACRQVVSTIDLYFSLNKSCLICQSFFYEQGSFI